MGCRRRETSAALMRNARVGHVNLQGLMNPGGLGLACQAFKMHPAQLRTLLQGQHMLQAC